jgi:integrase
MAAPLERTSTPGVYVRGSRWVAVYVEDGRQRRRSAPTFLAAREIKARATAREAARRAGPTLHGYALEWVDHYAGRGAHDVITDRTRREYRRLLIAYALAYFAPEERLRDVDEQRVRGFVDWLCRRQGPDGHRLRDRSVHNAVLPLRACLRHAHGAGLVVADVGAAIVLPRRRRGRAYEFDERRFLTRRQLARLLVEIPEPWRPLFALLAATGLRISEAVGLRVMDASLDTDASCVHVRRAIVNGQLTAPKSRHGRRTIPISEELADRLRTLVTGRGETEPLFRGAHGAALRAGNLRYRVLIPAANRAGVPWARFHTLRHTCAAMLIEAGATPLRLQRWMGHHSAAFTLDTYGHLLGDDLGPHLDLCFETK